MSVRQTIELPSIGDYKDVPVVEILVKPGDSVALDDPLFVLESDKATIEVPSPAAGRIVELKVEIGTRVSQGAAVAIIETMDVAPPPEATPAPAPSKVEDTPPEPPPPREATSPIAAPDAAAPSNERATAHASPSVRAFARELGVDLEAVTPSGRKGRIVREDLLGYVKQRIAAPPAAQAGFAVPPMPSVDFARYGEVERVSLTRIQQISGTTLHRNWVTIPHVTNFDEADVTDIEAFRVAINGEKRDPAARLTMVAFLLKASALALKAHPRFNASLDGDALVMKKYVHVGFAVDTPKGLLVPVVRDCDRKGILDIAADIGALAAKARDGKLAPADMEGGCFSVSSLGGIGGTGFTPIINAPEVAILGAARSQMQQRLDGAAFQPRLIMPVSLSWDHRVVDGVAAARFLGTVVAILGDLRRAAL